MSFVVVEPEARRAIEAFLAENGSAGPLRIELQFVGCCDPSLGLKVDAPRESDLVEELDGLTFIVDPQTQELAGEVSISYVDDRDRKGFLLTPANPVSEWDGFTACDIRV